MRAGMHATPASPHGSSVVSGDKVQNLRLDCGLTASRWGGQYPSLTTPQLTGKLNHNWEIKGQPLAAHFPSSQ